MTLARTNILMSCSDMYLLRAQALETYHYYRSITQFTNGDLEPNFLFFVVLPGGGLLAAVLVLSAVFICNE